MQLTFLICVYFFLAILTHYALQPSTSAYAIASLISAMGTFLVAIANLLAP